MSRPSPGRAWFFRISTSMLVCLTVLAHTSYQTFANVSTIDSTTPGSSQAAHYIVFEKQADGRVTPLYYRQVELAAPLETLDTGQLVRYLAQPDRNSEQMIVTLQSPDGQTAYQNVISVPRWLRGEFHGSTADGTIDGHWFPLDSAVFIVRVPLIEGTTLTLTDDRLAPIAHFDLNHLIAETPAINREAMRFKPNGIQTTGDPANRVDFLIMGDGYTSAQSSQFTTDANNMAAAFFGITPLAEYSNYLNVYSLFTASSQSGADHPPYDAGCSPYDPTCCSDPAMQSDPLRGTFVDTAFDSRYCAYGIHRLLVANTAAVLAAASAVPDWDQILLLVNDPTYGGSGGTSAVTSLHPSAVDIAQHEYGHSFVGLADEYESPYPGYPPCSDISGPLCQPNVTDVDTREQIKWTPWIEPTTPIPTEPEFDPMYEDVVGLFEGARYFSTGMYRPGQNCLMRSLGRPFCRVPSQAYVLKLYDGGWGVPMSGISLIEPGTTSPASTLIELVHPSTQVFQADILVPVGDSVEIAWLVDGVPVPGAVGNSFTYETGAAPSVEIKLLVKDATPLVHPEMVNTSLQAEHAWTVNVDHRVYLPIVLRNK